MTKKLSSVIGSDQDLLGYPVLKHCSKLCSKQRGVNLPCISAGRKGQK